MPNVRPEDLYGTFGGTPKVSPEGGGGTEMGVRASPEDFGAQTGAAIQKAGATGSEVADKYAQMATETKTNDVIVNQYAPAVAKLRSDFDALPAADKMKGYDDYISGLQNTQKQVIGNANSPLEAQLLGTYTARHVAQEIDGARRDADAAWLDHSSEMNAGMIRVEGDNVVRNGNNPAVVDQGINNINSHIAINGVDNGLDQSQIAEQQKNATAKTIGDTITHYTNAGDGATGATLFAKYLPDLSNDDRAKLGEMVDTRLITQASKNNADAIANGQPLPPAAGMHSADVRAAVANEAHKNGIDVNTALGLLRMESADGQNVGKIGNIGQNITLPKGAPLEDQVKALVSDLKTASTTATNALGRAPTPAESYVAYQQGAGGGAALLKAAAQNPDARALDILMPAYASSKNPMNMALRAIEQNGGNQRMTAGQFVASIEKTYWQKYNAAKISLPGSLPGIPADSITSAMTPQTVGAEASPTALNTIKANQPVAIGLTDTTQTPSPARVVDENAVQPEAAPSDNIANSTPESVQPLPGDAIMAAHTATSPARQPGSTPMQAMEHENDVYPAMLARALAIPDDRIRKGTLAYLRQQHEVITESASGYKQNLNLQAMRLSADPTFTSLDQITPEMRASLLETNPKMLEYLENKVTKTDKKLEEVNPADPAVMASRGQLLSMKYNAPNDYMNLDLSTFAGKLPSGEIVKNQEEQIKMRNDPEALATQNKDVGVINETVKDLLPADWRKSKPTDEDAAESESFKGRLIDEVYKMRDADNGKMPGRDDIRKLTVGLLGSYVAGGKDVDVDVDSHSWTGDKTIHPYQIPAGTDPKDVYVDGSDRQLYIPASYKQSFINSQLAVGKNPTEEDMIKSYKDVVGYKDRAVSKPNPVVDKFMNYSGPPPV